MRRSVRTLCILCCLALAGGLAVAGCSDSDDETTTTTAEAPATTEAPGFSAVTGEGMVRVTLDGQLPANWPEDFPLPDGATPVGSGRMAGEETTTMIGVFSATGTARETYEFYRDNPDLTVTDSSIFGSAGPDDPATVMLNGQFPGRVSVIVQSGTTYIIANLQTSSSGTTTENGAGA